MPEEAALGWTASCAWLFKLTHEVLGHADRAKARRQRRAAGGLRGTATARLSVCAQRPCASQACKLRRHHALHARLHAAMLNCKSPCAWVATSCPRSWLGLSWAWHGPATLLWDHPCCRRATHSWLARTRLPLLLMAPEPVPVVLMPKRLM